LNLLPNHVASSNGVSMMEVSSKEKVLKESMKRLYNMLVQSGFLKKSINYHLMSHLEGSAIMNSMNEDDIILANVLSSTKILQVC
jgi:hypothetical protein